MSAQSRVANTQQSLERITAEKNALELQAARADEEKKSLIREIESLKEKNNELELGRRTAEAKAASHRTRAIQLADELKTAEQREVRVERGWGQLNIMQRNTTERTTEQSMA